MTKLEHERAKDLGRQAARAGKKQTESPYRKSAALRAAMTQVPTDRATPWTGERKETKPCGRCDGRGVIGIREVCPRCKGVGVEAKR